MRCPPRAACFPRRLLRAALRARASPPRPPQRADAVGTGRSAAAAAASLRATARRLFSWAGDARVGARSPAHRFMLTFPCFRRSRG